MMRHWAEAVQKSVLEELPFLQRRRDDLVDCTEIAVASYRPRSLIYSNKAGPLDHVLPVNCS